MLTTLMWSGLIEIDHIGFEEAMELPLVEDQEMIQTCSPHAPQKPFTDGIRLRRPVRDSKHLDATCCRHSRKIRVEFPVVIPNQICGCVSNTELPPATVVPPKDR